MDRGNRGNTSNEAQGMGEFNLWDHFNENAVGTINTCAHQPDIGTGRPEFSQYEKAFKLHTGRTLTWYAIEQGFRSVLAMLREVDGLLVTEDGGKTYVQKKTMEDGEDLHNVPQDPRVVFVRCEGGQ